VEARVHVLGRIKTQQKQAAAAAVASDKSSSSSNSNNDRATKAPQPLTSSSSENQCFISASFRSFLSIQSDACTCMMFSLVNLTRHFEISFLCISFLGKDDMIKEDQRNEEEWEGNTHCCSDQAVSLLLFVSFFSFLGFAFLQHMGGGWSVEG